MKTKSLLVYKLTIISILIITYKLSAYKKFDYWLSAYRIKIKGKSFELPVNLI
jgi:hypothetical protein